MPATYDAYPTPAELAVFISNWNITTPTNFDVEVYAFGAINEWERLTDYKPFLAGSSASYRYDPPGPNRTTENRGGARRLFLDRGFTTVTEVVAGITADDPTGTVLVVDVDYRLWPVNAATDLQPYTAIDFIHVRHGQPNSIKVTGPPGYSVLLEAAVFRAILEIGAGEAMTGLQVALSSDAIEWAEGDVRERSSVELVQKMGTQWRTHGRAVAMQYRRAF